MNRKVIPIQHQTAISPADSVSPALTQLPPLSLYVHFPWCVEKCPYCDFNSHRVPVSGIAESDYLAALIQDVERALPEIWGRPIQTVFFGGGTPSLISPKGLDDLLSALRARLPIEPMAEITLEANPGTVDADRFKGFRDAGVTRLSLGVQSFNDHHLRVLGRIHHADEARRAVALALQYFERVNLDLMYALPGQTQHDLAQDLRQALAYSPQHISAYHLTIEPNTRFAHAPPALPDEDTAADMQEQVEATLGEAGYQHYETSAFAQPNEMCQHNLNYWLFGDYLGIGAGAHSKLSFPHQILRQMRHKHPASYLKAAEDQKFIQEMHAVSPDTLGFEFMMNALRLREGFPTALFQERTGLTLAQIENPLRTAISRGLIASDSVHTLIRPTPLGARFLNDLLGLFLH